ncbi:PAS domain-containing hybrid sensor histidine kinase/response regulator [Gemmatimonas groenlandica]|uniref:histidine kinase n=1 Tax=Gemmatimonas groenlandica TaxID=2732249 RepID=A0A6M4IT09_9BACT|nr:PAS domain-containing sensor histidine kinase [Gemmatimonas groenlandica]QJR37345.1 PAS domain S-box protein [Gemmatimonas groenlandica]
MPLPDWQQTLRALDVGVVVQARDLSIVYANPKATEMLGIAAAEMTSRTTDDARWDVIEATGDPVAPDEHPGPRALRSGEPVRGVILGVRRDDRPERAWIQVSAIPERSDNGVVERVVITLSDVSDAHREYREQDAVYKSVFRSMSEGLVLHAPDGSIRAANAAAERVLGLTVDQMSGRAATDPRWQLVTTDGVAADATVIPSEIARRTGQPAGETILGVSRASGALAWVAVRADPMFDPGDVALRGIVATFTDITAERETTLALEASRAQIQRVLDAVPGVVYQFLRPTEGPDRMPFLAGRIREVLGVDPQVAAANPMLLPTLLGQSEQAALFANIDAYVAKQEIFDHVLSVTLPDRGLRWLRVHGIPERTDEGVLYTGVILDVTEEHRMAEALRRRQRREAMGDMAAGIAHNFNNMLAVILPNVEMARDDASPETRASLSDAARAASSAADLVRRMLALGRAEPTAADASVDLAAITREAVHMCRQTFDRGITIVDDIALPVAFVRSSASELQQVVLNLCLNARDAMLGGDRCRLFVRLEADGADAVSLTVRDSGHGMSRDTLQRLGEPFFSTKGPGRGTGLGLASAFHSIADAGGTWRVESTLGDGTAFFVRLPLVAPQTNESSASSPSQYVFPDGVVLLIDDEPMVRTAVSRQLTRGGVRVEVAESAEVALDWLREVRTEPVLAVILDLSMPGLSGAQALPQIRSSLPRVPVIVLSGHVSDAQELVGAAMVLQKPISGRELLDALQSVIG